MTDQDKPPTPSKRSSRKEAKDKKADPAPEAVAAVSEAPVAAKTLPPAAELPIVAKAVAAVVELPIVAKAAVPPSAELPIIAKGVPSSPAAPEVRPLQPAAPSAAQAALQAAVEASMQTAAKAPELRAPAPVRAPDKKALGRIAAFRATTLPRLRRYAAYGLALTLAATAGWAGNRYLGDRDGASALAFSIGQSQAETRRIAEELRALKDSVAASNKGAVRAVQAPVPSEDLKAMKAGLAALNEGLERLKQDTGGRLTQLTAQLDRVEKSGGDAARITPLVERLERIERQTATLVTGSIAQQGAAAPSQDQAQSLTQVQTQVAKVEEAKQLDAKQQRLEGFVLREIFDGVALIESRRGIIEVMPGQNVAGIGRIEKFERRGRQWVVVTDKGFIPSVQ
jgi:hypothetical protein